MRVLVLGTDGYLGWPLTLSLKAAGHDVSGVDCYNRRKWIREVGGQSATPIKSMPERLDALKEHYQDGAQFFEGDITDYAFLVQTIKTYQPDAIVHLAEMPSAPYSMIDVEHCVYTHQNNLVGTLNLLFAMRDHCPEAHLIKLGTMGEYGTPNVPIPEGFFEIEYRGKQAKLPFPRQASSWYHQTKVHDSNNIMMACRMWGLRCTDVMQGVVYGITTDEMREDERLLTRFDFDQCFGTAINRFCAQAVIGSPLSPYGGGDQKRGFLPLCDSMACLSLSVDNPPALGEYRVFNQFAQVYQIQELAEMVQEVGSEFGLPVEIRNLQNPRVEAESHYYQPDHQGLQDLGYVPTLDIKTQLTGILSELIKHRQRIMDVKQVLEASIHWNGSIAPCNPDERQEEAPTESKTEPLLFKAI
jgi:UDP-sulfoquinovose synthase